MTPENFVYWLQGYFEILNNQKTALTEEQVQIIKEHLTLVFQKVTPIHLPIGVKPYFEPPYDVEDFNLKYQDQRLCEPEISSPYQHKYTTSPSKFYCNR